MNDMSITQEIEKKIEEANASDWMKYIEAAQSMAIVHGMEQYDGEIIPDWLRTALTHIAEVARAEERERIRATIQHVYGDELKALSDSLALDALPASNEKEV